MNQHTHLGVYGLIRWGHKILLIHKARGAYKGCWDLPGGRMEFGEQPETALHREIEEETGLTDVQVTIRSAESTVVHWVYQEIPEELHHIGILYDVQLKSDKQASEIRKDPDGEDSLGAAWFAMEQIHQLSLTPFASHMIFGRS
ncbi:NUDIX domain-containing protein [Paenibacillus sp. ACRRY]|uniref:NUDIX domain-containing protein n=1 Tax=Paenibacillus sp. ACRRY TaxID=2918208 RepID=UPI001EF63D0A|nr:NUDIX domain-containing protein [Paenibacillus sp. ACRRY]MCG7384735.1 NUDIX domain-containing protein [Paenibacillus sp. ACRRY]